MVYFSTQHLLDELDLRIRDESQGIWPTSVLLHQGLIASLVSFSLHFDYLSSVVGMLFCLRYDGFIK